jgi:release factor glutamine methyltransferase
VPLTLGLVLKRAEEHLAAKGVDSPRVDAEHLLAHTLGLRRIELYMQHDRPLTAEELERARSLVGRRGRREPLQYVIGEWGFRRLTLTLDPRALIPRPETETLVERALALVRGLETPRVLDVGTGSGAVALAIADEHPGARVTAIDISKEALALARENAVRTGREIELIEHDLRDGLPPGPWDLVVSNPPYVPASDRADLAPEVRDWEPAEALFADGMYQQLAGYALAELAPGGGIALEIGDDGQARSVSSTLAARGYAEIKVTQDLAGRDRVVEGRKA